MKDLNKMYRLVILLKRGKMQGNVIKCKYCGQSHERKKELYFAWGKYCNKCKGKNHFAKCCKSKKVHNASQCNNSDEVVEFILTVKKEELYSINSKGKFMLRWI